MSPNATLQVSTRKFLAQSTIPVYHSSPPVQSSDCRLPSNSHHLQILRRLCMQYGAVDHVTTRENYVAIMKVTDLVSFQIST